MKMCSQSILNIYKYFEASLPWLGKDKRSLIVK